VTPREDAEHRLLEDFTLDDSDAHYAQPATATAQRPPLLYTPAYDRTYKALRAARILVLALSFPKFAIPIFGAGDTPVSFMLVGTGSLFVTFVPLMMVINDSWTHKRLLLREGGPGRRRAGETRVAVLVEDPATGEERWMLQAKNENDGSGVEFKRWFIAALDISCGVVYILGMAFALFYIRDSPKMLAADITVMVIQL
jgi:hypothetical protein